METATPCLRTSCHVSSVQYLGAYIDYRTCTQFYTKTESSSNKPKSDHCWHTCNSLGHWQEQAATKFQPQHSRTI